ncbi:hypothetical protein MJO28_012198, partial [Puccinia striiformis f. sp. tritici]
SLRDALPARYRRGRLVFSRRILAFTPKPPPVVQESGTAIFAGFLPSISMPLQDYWHNHRPSSANHKELASTRVEETSRHLGLHRRGPVYIFTV